MFHSLYKLSWVLEQLEDLLLRPAFLFSHLVDSFGEVSVILRQIFFLETRFGASSASVELILSLPLSLRLSSPRLLL
jgi:hypothetical protein